MSLTESPCAQGALALPPRCAQGTGNGVTQLRAHVAELTRQCLCQLLMFKPVLILGTFKLWCQSLTAGPCQQGASLAEMQKDLPG